MNHSQLSIDATQWKRIGRRRFTMLAMLLTTNLSLIVFGVNSGLNRASVAIAAIPGTNDQSRAAVTNSSSATNHQETNGEQEFPASSLAESDTLDSNSAVATAAARKSQMVQNPVTPADENQSDSPIATAAKPEVETDASQPTGSESSKPSPNAQNVITDFEPSANEETPRPLTIINPPANRGIIHYAIDGTVQSLSPGEYQRLEAGQKRRVEFHQGDDLGYAERVVSTGFFVFRVGESGWELTQSADSAGRRLLRSCRLVESQD